MKRQGQAWSPDAVERLRQKLLTEEEKKKRNRERFPLILAPSERAAGFTDSVPWSAVERLRDFLEVQYNKRLEQLADAGGLTIAELWVATQGLQRSNAATVELDRRRRRRFLAGLHPKPEAQE